jgi:hypothetical protein
VLPFLFSMSWLLDEDNPWSLVSRMWSFLEATDRFISPALAKGLASLEMSLETKQRRRVKTPHQRGSSHAYYRRGTKRNPAAIGKKRERHQKIKIHRNGPTMVAYASKISRTSRDMHPFDSDSFSIAVDNCTTTSITNSLTDYLEPPQTTRTMVKGVGGKIMATKKGRVRWRIEDDEGKVHSIILPNVYYVPDMPFRLLAPHHWAQTAKDHFPQARGTWCGTYDDAIELHWDQS